MDTLQAALIAGAIITGQGAVWYPVTPETMLNPEPVIHVAKLGAVTNEYKPKPVKPQSCSKDDGLRCWTQAFE